MLKTRGRGRGGGGRGRGLRKRLLPNPPPPHLARPPPLPPSPSPAASTPSSGGVGAVEEGESFSMISKWRLDFGVVVRLVPGLVDAVRSAEERGGVVRIMFGSDSNDPSCNVIDVDGKEFKFTWFRDTGELCDIYEERESSDDEHGVLVECGSAWRKLNVQRVLDESTKNHVKRRTEEASRLHNSRTAIMLGTRNPSAEDQFISPADGSLRRINRKQQNERGHKKQKNKLDNGTVSTIASPLGKPDCDVASSSKNHMVQNIATGSKTANSFKSDKKHTGFSENAGSTASGHEVLGKLMGKRDQLSPQLVDLQMKLINLLSQYPNGIKLKNLNRLVEEMMPNSVEKMDVVLRNIANFKAPGRYLLKPEISQDNFKRRQLEGGSKVNMQESESVAVEMEKICNENVGLHTHMKSTKAKDLDISAITGKQKDVYLLSNDFNVSNHAEARACTWSDMGSGSETESDSSDSSSKDGSDVSSSSKETDVVDITTVNDNKDVTGQVPAEEPHLLSSIRKWGDHAVQEKNEVGRCVCGVGEVPNIEVEPFPKANVSRELQTKKTGGQKATNHKISSVAYCGRQIERGRENDAHRGSFSSCGDKQLMVNYARSLKLKLKIKRRSESMDPNETNGVEMAKTKNCILPSEPIKSNNLHHIPPDLSRPNQPVAMTSPMSWEEMTASDDGKGSYGLAGDIVDTEKPSFLLDSCPNNLLEGNRETESRIGSKRPKGDELSEAIGYWGKRMKCSLKHVSLFSQFEKREPELRGLISDYGQYKEYLEEFEKKYEYYLALKDCLDQTRDEFLQLGRDVPLLVKTIDKEAHCAYLEEIMEFHLQHRMRHLRTKKAFIIIYEELKTLKQRIKDFAEEYMKL